MDQGQTRFDRENLSYFSLALRTQTYLSVCSEYADDMGETLDLTVLGE